MAFLNVTPWDPAATAPAPASDPAAQEAAEYDVLFSGAFSIMDFIELGRISIEQADGGQATWDVGTNFARVLRRLAVPAPGGGAVPGGRPEPGRRPRDAHRAHHAPRRTRRRCGRCTATSVPTGRLEVPELDLHTIGDNLVPVQNENYYAQLVDRAGSGSLLRQAYTSSFGHCNFSPSELVAGVQAVMRRVTTGHWGDVATAASLEQAAAATNLGPAHFTSY